MMTSQAVVWLILLVLFLVMEAITLGLTTIWFAGGALTACIMAVLGAELLPQIIAFCIVSILLLVVTRPFAARWINRDRISTNAASLIGDTAVVTERIDNLTGQGQVQVRGQYWTARTAEEEQQIEIGRKVKIQRIDGVKLIVKEEL